MEKKIIIMSKSSTTVGVILWVTQEHGRSVLSGVLEHFHEASGVDVLTIPADVEIHQPLLEGLDGLIISLDPHAIKRWLPSFKGPTVAVPRMGEVQGVATVTTDSTLVGQEAAEHFLAMRVDSVVLCADPHGGDIEACHEAFSNTAMEGGVQVLPSPSLKRRKGQGINEWLKTLPASTGIFAGGDLWARRLAQGAKELGLRIPEDLSILGLGNSPIMCRTGGIGLSSIAIPAESLGRRAAEVLEGLRKGHTPSNVTLKPTGTITRDSTEIVCVDDPLVAQVAQQIRKRFLEDPGTAKLAHEQGIARRTLDQRFRAEMGCSIHEEVVRCRLKWATGMLSDGKTDIKILANRMGMQLSNFSRFIRDHTGVSPREFRRQSLDGGEAPSIEQAPLEAPAHSEL